MAILLQSSEVKLILDAAIMVMVTTMMTPISLKWSLGQRSAVVTAR